MSRVKTKSRGVIARGFDPVVHGLPLTEEEQMLLQHFAASSQAENYSQMRVNPTLGTALLKFFFPAGNA